MGPWSQLKFVEIVSRFFGTLPRISNPYPAVRVQFQYNAQPDELRDVLVSRLYRRAQFLTACSRRITNTITFNGLVRVEQQLREESRRSGKLAPELKEPRAIDWVILGRSQPIAGPAQRLAVCGQEPCASAMTQDCCTC